ncbi:MULTISPECIES: hypothetical protein [Micromonospora]|nr:hypothetical protein [Micromonospora yangpuensis]
MAAVFVVFGCCVGDDFSNVFTSDSGSTAVPPPTSTQRQDTVPILARAATEQGLCYGWKLVDGSQAVTVGSNLGDGIAVEDNPGCPRWLQLVADVDYTSASSELEDSASFRVAGSPDLDRARLGGLDTDLARFGLTEEVFVDDPGWAVTRAASVLPLLAAEAGLVEPLATAPAAPAAQVTALPDAGSDLWRDRSGYLFAVGALLLAAVLLIIVGLVQRSRQRRAAPAPTGRQRAR